MNKMVWLIGAAVLGTELKSRGAWFTFLLGAVLVGCGPSEGKDNSSDAGAGTGASSSGGASGTGTSGSGGAATGGSASVIDDPSFTLGKPETLATGQPVPIRLVLLGDQVYFASRGLDDQPTGSIMTVPKNGGSVAAFASSLPYLTGLTVKGTDTLIYTTYGLSTASPRDGSIVIQPIGGTAQTTSPVQFPFEPLWADDALSLFSMQNLLLARPGQVASTLVTLSGPRRRLHDGGRIYIVEGPSSDLTSGRLRVWSDSQTDAPVLNDTLSRPEGIVMANGRLYITCPGNGTVVRVDPTSGASETVASGHTAPWGIAADSANVYFADRSSLETCVAGTKNGAIVRLPLGGGAAETIASGLPCPSTIAVDATGIYWVDNGSDAAASDGSVMKIAKIRG